MSHVEQEKKYGGHFCVLNFCTILHSLTKHNELGHCLREAVFVPELYLDLSCVLPLAPAEEQAALTRRFLYPCIVVVLELVSLFVPLNLYGFMASEMQFEDGVVPHFNRHGLSESTEVFRVNPRGI